MSTISGPTHSVVLITASEPEPRSFGKQVVLGGLLDHLVERLGGENVHVIIVGRLDVERPPTTYQRHVLAKPSSTDQLRAVATRIAFPPHSSLQEAALWSPRLAADLAGRLQSIGADLEIWDTMRMGQYARMMPYRRRVLYADDLFSKRYASMLDRIRVDPTRVANPLGEFQKQLPAPARRAAAHPWVYRPLLHLERRLTARSENMSPLQFHTTLLVNPEETQELAARSGSTSVRTLLPLIREPREAVRRYDGSPTFVFLGGLDFPPNRDGLSWFLTNCREQVLSALPDFKLLIIGRGADRPLPEAAAWGSHVQPVGWVEDLDNVLLTSAGMISPLRIGSGIKIKVMEALARGLPVVATPHGVLGLRVSRANGCLVRETPAGFAAALAEAAAPATNGELSAAALATWHERFSPAVAGETYDEVLGLPLPFAHFASS